MVRQGITNFACKWPFRTTYSQHELIGAVQDIAAGAATIVEIYAAVIGACMPTLVPIYRQLRYCTSAKGTITGSPNGGLALKRRSAQRKHFSNISFSERLSDNVYMSTDYSDTRRTNFGRAYNEIGSYEMDGVMVSPKKVWCEHSQLNSVV